MHLAAPRAPIPDRPRDPACPHAAHAALGPPSMVLWVACLGRLVHEFARLSLRHPADPDAYAVYVALSRRLGRWHPALADRIERGRWREMGRGNAKMTNGGINHG